MSFSDLYQVQEQDESAVVLCPELYNKLKRFPGGVNIANPGEAYSATNSGEYYRVCCIFCGDTRHRLWINHTYGQVGADGRRRWHLAICYNENCLENYENWKYLRDMLFGFRNVSDRDRPVFFLRQGNVDSPTLHEVTLPGEVIPITSLYPEHKAYQYMVGTRRYAPHILDRYEISYCSRAKPQWPAAQDKIVFPIRMHEELVGWQCRCIGNPLPGSAKYYTLPGMHKRLVLYNFDRAKHEPMVVLVEGVTDCHAVGDASVGLLGRRISQHQLNLLLATWDGKPIIVLLDADAQKESDTLLMSLLAAGRNPVVRVRLPAGYDPSDYDRNLIWSAIYAAARECGVRLPTG